MGSISQGLTFLKSAITDSVPAELIERLCRDLGHRWRKRDLDPVITVHLFLQQILHGNTAITHLRHLSKRDFTPSAYCQARLRLPRSLYQRLQRAVADRSQAEGDHPDTRWMGHRLFLLDGSSFSMPDTEELRTYFGQPTGQAEGCGFPVAHLMALFDATRGYLLEATAQPLFTHDLSQVAGMHARLEPGDVLVGDRAFGTYAHLALCQQQGIHGLFRAHQHTIVDFRPGRPHNAPGRKVIKGLPRSRWLKQLGPQDQWVEYHKPKECPEWMTPEQEAALPEKITVRELRYRIECPGYRTHEVTLVTTLLDAEKYPAAELARVYGLRWGVEIHQAGYRSSSRLYLGGVAA